MQKKPTRKCLVCKTRFEVKSNAHWICSIECSKVKGNEAVEKKKEQIKKTEWTKEKAVLRITTHSKENKKYLQDEINKLAKKIDAVFGYECIDCCGRKYGKQIDAAHLISRGSNSSLRYNLHNIHSADSQCNNYSPVHESGYKKGLVLRYGKEYLETVENLPVQYKELRLSNQEIHDKLTIVRKLNRTFETFQITDGVSARNLFNQIIGIYN